MKKTLIIATILTCLSFTYAQSVDVKDSHDNSLITVNDEGDQGSITILPGREPDILTDKLYNFNGTLKWNGKLLENTLWTPNGSDIYRSSGNVGIGIINPFKKLDVYGGARFQASESGLSINLSSDHITLGYKPTGGSGLYNNVFFYWGITEFGGKVGIGTSTPNSKLSIVGLNEYANNAAAILGGLAVGDLYRTGDLLKIVH